MSEVKVTKRRTHARGEAPLSERLMPMMSFVAIPFALMRGVAEGLEHMFGITPGAEPGRWTPVMDFEQSEGNLEVTVELPGFKKEDVNVELSDGFMIITAEHEREHKEGNHGVHRWERRFGQFYRSIPLPEGAKTDHVKAELHDGVLKISMPVAEKKRVRHAPQEKAAA